MSADDWVVILPRRGIVQTLSARIGAAVPLIRLWTVRTLRSRYRQSLLRSGWGVIQPAALLLTYGWVLTSVLHIGQEPVPYLSFAWAGLVPFTFVQQSLGQGVGSIQISGSVISKVYFPREVLPLAEVGVACFDLLPTSAILIVLTWIQIGSPSVHVVGLLVGLVLLIIWTAGLTVLAATATVFQRDLKHAMPLLLRVLFIVTPIMYPIGSLSPLAQQLSRANPLAVVVDIVRDATVRQQWPDWPLVGVHFIIGAFVLAGSILVIRRYEPSMTDRV